MGGKKSTVLSSARLSAMRYTPASSEVSGPTSRSGSVLRGRCRKISAKRPASIFAAQPTQLAHWVKRILIGDTLFMSDAFHLLSLPQPADDRRGTLQHAHRPSAASGSRDRNTPVLAWPAPARRRFHRGTARASCGRDAPAASPRGRARYRGPV